MKRTLNSFRNAIRGFSVALSEKNMRIHAVAAMGVLVLGFVFQISAIEWMLQTFAISLVFAVELINSALERLCDHVNPHYHEVIKNVKDISAAAVLIAAILSVVIGLIIYIPKFLSL